MQNPNFDPKHETVVKVIEQIATARNIPFFPNREILLSTPQVVKAKNLILQATQNNDVTRAIINALNQMVGTRNFGEEVPYIAGDPALLVRGKKIGKKDNGVYLLCAINNGLCFPGGFGGTYVDSFHTPIKEIREESGVNAKDVLLKHIVGESSNVYRAPDRFGAYGSHIISYLSLLILKPNARIQPKAGSDATGFEFIRLFLENGEIDWESINSPNKWRDDHLDMVERLVRWWDRQRLYISKKYTHITDFLMTLPNLPAIETIYSPTPDSIPPNTWNVELAREIIHEILRAYTMDTSLKNALVNMLRGWFVPFYKGPVTAVDPIIVGRGENANSILMTYDEATRSLCLPGHIVKHMENVIQGCAAGVYEKQGYGFTTPRGFAGLISEWSDPQTLRDYREPFVSLGYFGGVTDLQFENLKYKKTQWIKVYDPSTQTVVDSAFDGTQCLYAHDRVVTTAINRLLSMGLAQPGCSLHDMLQQRFVAY